MPIELDITFYLDPVNGSDAARASFTATQVGDVDSPEFSTAVPHGLVAGAVVDFSGFLFGNGAYRVSAVLSPTTFWVDEPVNMVLPLATGTVTPRGGASWADAWQTPASGATAARLASGGVRLKTTVKVAHGGVPTAMGISSTLTKQDNTVDLGPGRGNGVDWQVIDQCETAFTPANGGLCLTDIAYRKQGTTACTVSRGTGVTFNTKYAYRALAALDLSAYDTVSFWVATSVTGGPHWTVRLCSDALGDTAVHTFSVQSSPQSSTLFRTVFFTGSPLSATVNSISIFSGALTTTGTLRIDNIVASNAATGIHHDVLVGAAPPITEPHTYPVMFPIRALNSGTTLTLDGAVGSVATSSPATGRWPFATNTYPLVRCGAAVEGARSSSVGVVWQLATNTNPTEWIGGWNPLTNLQDFTTIIRINGAGVALATAATMSCTLSNFSVIGATTAVAYTGTGNADVKVDFYSMVGVATFIAQSLRSFVCEVNCVYACGLITMTSVSSGATTRELRSTFRILIINSVFSGQFLLVSVVCDKAFLDFDECIASISASVVTMVFNGGAQVLVNYRRDQATSAVVTTAGTSQFRIAQFTITGAIGSTHVKNTTFAVTAVQGSISPGLSFVLNQRQGVAGADHWQLDSGLQFEHITPVHPSTDYYWVATGAGLPYVAARFTLQQAWRLPIALFAVRAGAAVTIRAAVSRSWTAATSIPYHGIVVRGGSVGSVSPDLYGHGVGATGVNEEIVLVVPAPAVACVLEVEYFVYVAPPASTGTRTVTLSNITCEQA